MGGTGDGGMMMRTMQAARDKPVLTTVAASFVAVTSIIGGMKALGIDPIPWATAGDIERIENDALTRDEKILKRLDEMSKEQKQSRRDQNVLLREFWEKRRDEAIEEMAANPNSRTARAQKLEAERQISKIDQQEAGVPTRSHLPPED